MKEFFYRKNNDFEYEIYLKKSHGLEIFCHLSENDLDIFIDVCNAKISEYKEENIIDN